ncbi:MAG: hypothetical protein O2931_08425 [Planctomycetota bacterium]|nr:hypothetical protein [Planctomycetota bacterium]MDA1178805.1 hypothetical protein [Planctomycetota bacterium]
MFPAYSPNGQRLACFSVTYPNPLMTTPTTTSLFTVNANGSGRTPLVHFASGLFPLGLSWTPDGSQLVFSMANQSSSGGTFLPAGQENTAFLRAISSSGGSPFSIAGAPNGLFPSVIAGGGTSPADLTGDGRIDAADLSVIFGNWARSGAGDLSGDGIVDAADLAIVFSNWTGDSVSALPEPVFGTAGLVLFITLARSTHRRPGSERR